MNTTKSWPLELTINEAGRETIAEASLTTGEGARLTGRGVARRNPRDSDVPMIGDELAVSRALSDLAHKLLDAAAYEIGEREHRQVHLTH